ncbi:MAG: hypothetical protein Q9227_002280 [Pyrenula ochraceoflavens]
MFGALNRFISRLDSEPQPQSYSNQGNIENSYGFQVLRNNNPGLPIEPWFDFIIGINGRLIVCVQVPSLAPENGRANSYRQDNPNPELFVQEIRNLAGATVSLEIWSAKGQQTHTLRLPIPAPPAAPSLGLTLQLASLASTQNIWHILSIPSPLSPAYQAGLLPHSDYILGTPSGTLRGEGAFGELVEDHLNRSLVLWVYNSEFDVVREVELVPRRGWGGDGALGAILGYGALHRLPVGLGEEVQGPGEAMFEAPGRESTEKQSQPLMDAVASPPQFLNPKQSATTMPAPPMTSPNAPLPKGTGSTPTAKAGGRKQRNYAAPSPNRAFDEYFAEGEKKSKEEDFVSSRKGPGVAPPPKVGPPPLNTAAKPAETVEESLPVDAVSSSPAPVGESEGEN